jgi:hypothetical protein
MIAKSLAVGDFDDPRMMQMAKTRLGLEAPLTILGG